MYKEEQVIEFDIARMFMRDGIIHIYYKPDTYIGLNNVKPIIQERIALAKGKPRPVLVDGRYVKYWTKESKNYSHSKEAMQGMTAIAVVSNSIVARIHMNFILLVFKPSIPILVFENIPDALNWLSKYK